MSLQINKQSFSIDLEDVETKQDKNGFGYCVSMQTHQIFLNRSGKVLFEVICNEVFQSEMRN